MTTIAYAGNGHIAADSRIMSGSAVFPKQGEKLLLIQHQQRRYIAGIAGTPGFGIELVKHHLLNRQIAGVGRLFTASKDDPDSYADAIVVHLNAPSGTTAFFVDANGRSIEITGIPWAVGSGREFAIGAMAAGADAEQAVAIAARFDECTGGTVKTMKLAQMAGAPLANFTTLQGGEVG